MHAEIQIGNSSDAGRPRPAMGARGPRRSAARRSSHHPIMLYVEDADASFNKAVRQRQVVLPRWNSFYGDRSGIVEDPFDIVGHLDAQ